MVHISSKLSASQTHFIAFNEVPLVTMGGKVVKIQAFGLPQVTSPAPPIHREDLEPLFPNLKLDKLVRRGTKIDVLLGADYFGLHPKVEVASCGPNLSVMEGALGQCLVGSHPRFTNDSFEERVDIDTGLADR